MVIAVRDHPHTIELLAIQFWIHDPGPIHRAVHLAGFTARIQRVDIEPALHAALGRQAWDLVIVDPATPDLSQVSVQRAMDGFRRNAPLIVLDDVVALPDRIRDALCARRS